MPPFKSNSFHSILKWLSFTLHAKRYWEEEKKNWFAQFIILFSSFDPSSFGRWRFVFIGNLLKLAHGRCYRLSIDLVMASVHPYYSSSFTIQWFDFRARKVLEAVSLLSQQACYLDSGSRHFVADSILKIPLFTIAMMIFSLDFSFILLFLFLLLLLLLSRLHFQSIGISSINVLHSSFFIRHSLRDRTYGRNKLNNFRNSYHFTIVDFVAHKCRFWLKSIHILLCFVADSYCAMGPTQLSIFYSI